MNASRVFFVTAAWSIFAYIWLYMILAVFSPGVVQVWEEPPHSLLLPSMCVLWPGCEYKLLLQIHAQKYL